MIVSLVTQLRAQGVRIGIQELVSLGLALKKGLHENSIEQFYYVSRAILIHDEAHLDDFDQVFGNLFRDLPLITKLLLDDLERWLQDPLSRPELSDARRQELKSIDFEELRRLFEERLKEQTERHDGGSYWIGTGGKSPFGTSGLHPSGVSLGRSQKDGSGGGGVGIADARKFRGYRKDLTLDVRQFEVALKRLRHFNADGVPDELDLEASIDATARNFGELEIVYTKPRKPDTRVILMMDVGGSMDPHSLLLSQLFTAAKKATHWKELRTYYFHNCIYGEVFETERLRDRVSVEDLMRECDGRYKLILVGDASMAPSELNGEAFGQSFYSKTSGFEWLLMLRKHFVQSVWLNPWRPISLDRGSTVEQIASILPMYPLTLLGLEEALKHLNAKTK